MTYVTETLELTSAQQTYLEQQLVQVSRSFALVVPFLEAPLQQYAATAYLLCRVLDNIEDSGRDAAWREARFGEFNRLLREPHHAPDMLEHWEQDSWPALTDAERRIMGLADGRVLWQIYAMIPQSTQDTIRLWAGIMAEGMKMLGDSDKPPCTIRRLDTEILETEADYNAYCYFVAGTVGHLVTELVIQHYQFADDTSQYLRARAEACGRGLQKTNIVKDFLEDVERGVCYLPDTWLREADYAPLTLQGAAPSWKARVLDDVLVELAEATAYLTALPHSAEGYRRAALLCLLPAYQTLLSGAQQQASLFTPAHSIKISHQTMAQCLSDAQAMFDDDAAIRRYAHQVTAQVHAQFTVLA